jgi:hypothetical protein
LRWYFASDEAGGLGSNGAHAKLAVLSALHVGGLSPVLLYYGRPTAFTSWMTEHGVTVLPVEPSFLDAINDSGTFRAHSIGHWLRIAIPRIETTEEFVLYTDCDVSFVRGFPWSQIRPRLFAAAPEFKPDNWNYFNSGIMVLNIPAMQRSAAAFEDFIRNGISGATGHSFDDQIALNQAYRGHWDRLDPVCNWKPYWPYQQQAAILHFHGPKLDNLEAIACGDWPRDNPVGETLARLLDGHIDSYITWCTVLGDAWQAIDLPTSLRLHRLASSLYRYKTGIVPGQDMSFMDCRMFSP